MLLFIRVVIVIYSVVMTTELSLPSRWLTTTVAVFGVLQCFLRTSVAVSSLPLLRAAIVI